MLIDSFMEPFVLMDKTRTPDGEGGFVVQYVDSAEFDGALTLDTTMQARIAEQQGVTSVYTLTTAKSCTLEFHDVIRRKSDGETFRVTKPNSDKRTPAVAGIQFAQATVEKWSIA